METTDMGGRGAKSKTANTGAIPTTPSAKPGPVLTGEQDAALRKLVDQYSLAIAREEALRGPGSAKVTREKGIALDSADFKRGDLNTLMRKGYIKQGSVSVGSKTELVRRDFGRSYSTRLVPIGGATYVPTALGLQRAKS